MKYTVVSISRANPDRALQELITEVNRMIETGWKPLGGITFCQWAPPINSYHQAMVFLPISDDLEAPK
jgi:hypothetical protein